ncbi:RHS repeat-associated core domain-containing protein [Vitiosangium sp. GDMCC 1.1324]|uniref:RHS repeat-associated core domain-containing protein n=1 Tax=Vitiosangium sp. (strain GDMCC 1.1324) TaxID=2138576 RepID=UPI00130ED9D9|nr:RHS repeat-associated core domain-containing protein [Vitiosangium sp. GDMCC 1.1324]
MFVAVLSLWLLYPPGAALAQSAPGATPANFDVDPDGNATARIELEVPPGPHGMQPKLALSYSSSGENGLLGTGWSLQGLSAITRSGPSPFYDGTELRAYEGRVSYSSDGDGSSRDRFLLDGKRLIAVKNGSGTVLSSVTAQNDAYGKPGTVYHSALESWSKVTSQGTAGSGPQYFTVYKKDGTMLEYGNTADSRIEVPGGSHVRVWALNKVVDPNGNSMTFSYTEDNANGEYRLASILYAANGGFAARNNVTFVYEERDDDIRTYHAGYRVNLTKRLKEIQTHVGTTRVRTYKLAYGYGSATRRSRLTSVQECDGAGACMPATTFAYSDFTADGSFNIVTSGALPAGLLTDYVNLIPGDYNGDGKTDLIRQEKSDWDNDNVNTFNVLFSMGNGQFNFVTPNESFYQSEMGYDPGVNIIPGDYNGDGVSDFLRQERASYDDDDAHSFDVLFSRRDGYFNRVIPSGGMYQYDLKADPGAILHPGDYNGDGVTDFIRQETGSWTQSNDDNTFSVYFSRRDGYFDKALPSGEIYQKDLKYPPGANIYPGDYNGDGATDFLRQERDGWDDDDDNTFSVYFSRRDGYFDRVVRDSTSSDSGRLNDGGGVNIIRGDFNGDGLQDFIRQEKNGWDNDEKESFAVFFSRGDGQFDFHFPAGAEYQAWLRFDPGANIIPGDFNGDGLEDFIRQEKGGADDDEATSFNIYYSRGDGTFDIRTPAGSEYQARLRSDPGVTLTVGDFNGDGVDDFMATRKGSPDGSTYYWMYLAKGPRPDLLTSISDGLKKTTTITYKPLTDSSVYTKGSGAVYPEVDEQPTRPVVASFSFADANGNSVQQTYTYEALRSRRDGSETRGFAKVHKTDTASNVKQTTEYNQDTFLGGQAKSITKLQGNTVLEATRYTYFADSASGSRPYLNVRQVLLQRQDHEHYVQGALKYTTREEYTYDGYGNITKLVDYGDVNVAAERRYSLSQYSNDETAWRIGLITATKQSKADGSSLSAWDAAKDLTWEKLVRDTKGNVSRQERYDDQNSTWLANTFTYNNFGNPVSSTDPTGSVATLVYDDSNTYVRERHVANGSQPELITRFTYDVRFGELTSQTDPNGHTLTYVLDGFGRVTSGKGPRPDNPSQSVELLRIEFANTAQGQVKTTSLRTDWNEDYGSTKSPWSWVKEYSDGLGRVYKKESPGPDNRVIVEDTSYTPQGWVSRRTFPHWSTETGSSLPGISITYDAQGLPVTIDSVGIITTLTAGSDGKSFTRTEAYGTPSARTTSYSLNSRLKVVSKTDGGSGVTRFEYDPLSRPTRVVDPDGVTHDTSYTSLGLKRQVSNLDTGTTSFQYSNGLLSSETDARGNVTSYAYDLLSRIQRKTVTWTKAGVAQTTTVEYQYDTAPGETAYTSLAGNVYKVITRTQDVVESEYRFGYDLYGQVSLLEVRLKDQPSPFVFRYGYDPRGRRTEQIFPDNARALTSYDAASNMSVLALEDAIRGVRGASANYTAYRSYTARGEPETIEYGNGLKSALTYEAARGTLQRHTLAYGDPSSTSSPKLLDEQYVWDWLGDVTQINDLRTGADGTYDPHPFHNNSRTFTYTRAGRLESATAPGTYGSLTFSYSPGGNLLTKDGATFTMGTGHRVTSGQKDGASAFSATYDASGNMLTKVDKTSTSWSYTYDGSNRLIEVWKNGTLVNTFAYDYTGRRTQKTDVLAGTTTWYVWQDYEVTVFGGSASAPPQHTKYLNGLTGPVASITHVADEVLLNPATFASSGSILGSLTSLKEHFGVHPERMPGALLLLALGVMAVGLARQRREQAGASAPPLRAAWARHGVPVMLVVFLTSLMPLRDALALDAPGKSRTPGGKSAGYPVVGTHFFHKDHSSSTQLVSDYQGKVLSRAVYKPFGELDLASSAGSNIHRLKFGGQELDAESGLYYFNARYYDASIGRFISADSLMGASFLQVDAFNRYAFAGNNPIRNVDPSGHSFIISLIIGAVMGAVVAMTMEAVHQASTQGWVDVGQVFLAGLGGLLSSVFAGVLGGAAGKAMNKALDKALDKRTKKTSEKTKRALGIGVEVVAGAAADVVTQAVINGIQVARGEEVYWTQTMLISLGTGAAAGALGGSLDSYNEYLKGDNNNRPPNTGGFLQQMKRGLNIRDHVKEMGRGDWFFAISTGVAMGFVFGCSNGTLNQYFADPENSNDATGDTFSTSGADNAPTPHYNGRMIINVVGSQSSLGDALMDQSASDSSK